jgi:hypothetical protein
VTEGILYRTSIFLLTEKRDGMLEDRVLGPMFLLYANDFSFNIRGAEYVYAQMIQICCSPGWMKKGRK